MGFSLLQEAGRTVGAAMGWMKELEHYVREFDKGQEYDFKRVGTFYFIGSAQSFSLFVERPVVGVICTWLFGQHDYSQSI